MNFQKLKNKDHPNTVKDIFLSGSRLTAYLTMDPLTSLGKINNFKYSMYGIKRKQYKESLLQ